MNRNHIIAGAIGLTMVVFGINQIKKPTVWEKYIPTWLATILPVQKHTAMRVHGSANILLGLGLILNIKPHILRRVSGLWWVWVAPFCGQFDWRTTLRDATIATTLLSIAKERHK